MSEQKVEEKKTTDQVIDELQKALAAEQRKTKDLQAKTEELAEILVERDEEIERQGKENKRLDDHAGECRRTIERLEGKLKVEAERNKEPDKTIKALQDQLKAAKDELDELKKAAKDAKKAVSEIQLERIKELEKDVRKLTDRLARKEEEIGEKNREINGLKTRLNAEIQHRKAEVAQVEPVPAPQA